MHSASKAAPAADAPRSWLSRPPASRDAGCAWQGHVSQHLAHAVVQCTSQSLTHELGVGHSPIREPAFDEGWDSDASQSLHSVDLRSQNASPGKSETQSKAQPQQQQSRQQPKSSSKGSDLMSFDSNAGASATRHMRHINDTSGYLPACPCGCSGAAQPPCCVSTGRHAVRQDGIFCAMQHLPDSDLLPCHVAALEPIMQLHPAAGRCILACHTTPADAFLLARYLEQMLAVRFPAAAASSICWTCVASENASAGNG